ncbi:hypothetical protein NQZ68_038653 [Dissostichus eleginoides]|nr:hypothetical protein NQZ68_038653 [Dissostichus eleginoides]
MSKLQNKWKNKALEKENEILKKKVESLMTDCEQFKAERQRIHNVIKNRDHQRNQLLHCKNELSALGKKMAFQQTELKREHKQNETVKEELESVKKELQSVKQGAFTQRTEQQHLKQQLDQQSSANKKDRQCKKQTKEIHFLNLEKQTLEKERCITESNAEEQKQELRKCEEDLQTLKEKFKESKKVQEKGTKIAIIQESPHKIKKPRQKVPHPKVQSLQKELLAQAEELRATQKLCENKSKSIFNVGEITRLLKFPGVMRTFVVKIIAGLPSGIFQVMLSIIAMEFFKLKPEQTGYLIAYFGITSMVIQGGVIGRMTARYSERSLLLLSIGISSLVGLAQAYMQNVFQFCLTVIPMMFALSTFNVITDSMLTKNVPSSDTGTMLGLCASVQSLLRTVGPTVGGFLYVNYGISSIGLIQFVVNIAVFVYLLQHHFTKTAEQKE